MLLLLEGEHEFSTEPLAHSRTDPAPLSDEAEVCALRFPHLFDELFVPVQLLVTQLSEVDLLSRGLNGGIR